MFQRDLSIALHKRCKKIFSGDISDERILCEGAAAEPADSGIEAPRASVVCGEKFLHRGIRPAVQMNADLKMVIAGDDSADEITDASCVGRAHRIRERNLLDGHVSQDSDSFGDLVYIPEV